MGVLERMLWTSSILGFAPERVDCVRGVGGMAGSSTAFGAKGRANFVQNDRLVVGYRRAVVLRPMPIRNGGLWGGDVAAIHSCHCLLCEVMF